MERVAFVKSFLLFAMVFSFLTMAFADTKDCVIRINYDVTPEGANDLKASISQKKLDSPTLKITGDVGSHPWVQEESKKSKGECELIARSKCKTTDSTIISKTVVVHQGSALVNKFFCKRGEELVAQFPGAEDKLIAERRKASKSARAPASQ